MRLRTPEDLDAELAKGLAPVYLISGDEPLLVQEAADAVRTAARGAGVDERRVFHVESGFDWDELLQSAGSMSLFASRRLLELRLRNPSPGQAGGKVLAAWAEHASGDDILLVITGRIDAAGQKTRWFKALEAAGVHLPVWPVDLAAMPRWLRGRLRRAGVALDEEAFEALLMRVEGNLLAASQAVQRLALAEHEGPWTAAELRDVLDDDARYTPFELADRMLAGEAEHAHRILRTLRVEGAEPLMLVGALARDVRLLRNLHDARRSGEGVRSAMGRLRVFKRRQPLLERALDRLDTTMLDGALRDLAVVDQAFKGALPLDHWDELDRLVLRLAGVRTTPLGIRARSWLENG